MSLRLFMMNVEQGQAVLVRLPNSRWCAFDLGASSLFSPLGWRLQYLATCPEEDPRLADLLASPRLLYASVSHIHGDHLSDSRQIYSSPPEFVRTVDFDDAYLSDAVASSTEKGSGTVREFADWYRREVRPGTACPEIGGVVIRELSLPVTIARGLGGSSNAKVNNASIVTRLEYAGRSVLLCGDLEREAWDFALSQEEWRAHVASVDVLAAPHHGHTSGYSQGLLDLAKPRVVLVSVASYDPSVDPRYSSSSIPGIWHRGACHRRLTTRDVGHIGVCIQPRPFAGGDVVIATGQGIQGTLGPSHSEEAAQLIASVLSAFNPGTFK